MIFVENITKSYGPLQVLKGISLQIELGRITTIVGPSGAGKSTLLQIIGTLDKPDAGDVFYRTAQGDTHVFQLKDGQLSRFRNQNIGFVFQSHRLLPEFTMAENVAMPALINGTPHKQAMDRAMELIAYMGLAHRASHKPGELSGGECQRAAVARALVNNPKIVLADEPSGSLDSHNRNELHKIFFDLCRDRGASFVIVTHDENLAADSHAVVHLRDGRIEKIVTEK